MQKGEKKTLASISYNFQNLRNLTEEKPAWPSKTAAKEKPFRQSGLIMTSSSISSLAPCNWVDPHLIPATPVNDDAGASMAIAEQHLIRSFTTTFFLVGLKLELRWIL